MMEYSYLTDPGKVRDHNEDSVTALKNASGEILMAVADGMGGHKDGEVASSIAVSHIGKRFRDLGCVGNKEDAINWIKEVVSEANVLIYRYTEEHPESSGMGTTIVMAVLTEEFLLFGNFDLVPPEQSVLSENHDLITFLLNPLEQQLLYPFLLPGQYLLLNNDHNDHE